MNLRLSRLHQYSGNVRCLGEGKKDLREENQQLQACRRSIEKRKAELIPLESGRVDMAEVPKEDRLVWVIAISSRVNLN
jgi:hypothetical protein